MQSNTVDLRVCAPSPSGEKVGMRGYKWLILFSSPQPSRQLLLRCSTSCIPASRPAGEGVKRL